MQLEAPSLQIVPSPVLAEMRKMRTVKATLPMDTAIKGAVIV